ncbi:MAG TPA: PDZ domain-containing protein [Pyrinomonadaceae bacterium]|nr:PDZ domain-containing protein [Pyrinomonadaceae bacterium]
MDRIFQTRFVRRRFLMALSLIAFSSVVCFAQPDQPLHSVTYRLGMSRPVSHLFEVTIEVELAKDVLVKSLDFQMPKWSPGRYAVFDFAKNVQEFEAVGGICPAEAKCKMAAFPVRRIDDQTWRVSTMNTHRLTIRYKVFGNDLSGTFSQLDSRHANFNGGSLFMYVVNHKADPVKLVIEPPAGWRIVNGRMELTDRGDQREWQFPNYDVLIDTPTEIASDWSEDQFDVDGKRYHVIIHSFGEEGGKRAGLVRDIEKIVRVETAMWGAPEFDSYTFLIHFAADDHSGDGMEHLTSTQIIEPGALAEDGVYASTLDTVAHEFFHVWNVKRLRPLELGPWDFTRPLNTRALWIAEGITNYYGHLMKRRAELSDDTAFFRRESETITAIETEPGNRLMSAEESSLSAPFLDGAPHKQQTNLENTSISYYPKGELIGLVLDLIIRGKTNGKASLDDVMRRMYEEFYLKSPNASYYLRGRGYTTEDFERVASEVAGFDLSEFFKSYVRGIEMPPYNEALGFVGLFLIREQSRQPFSAGILLDWQDKESLRISAVRPDSPAENAGLQAGDEIKTLGKKNIARENLLVSLARYKSGDRVPVTIKRDRRTIQTTLLLGEPDRFEYRIDERRNATPEQKTLRTAWLTGSRALKPL